MSDLVAEFVLFRKHAQRCRKVFDTHSTLFGRDSNAIELLRSVAPNFFYDLSDWLADYHIVLAARLTDPAKSSGRTNLTVMHLQKQLEENDLLSGDIRSLADEVQNYRKLIANWRNRKLVHIDREEALAPPAQSVQAFVDLVKFHSSLDRFCFEVAEAIGAPQLSTIRIAPGAGGVSAFLMKMKRAFGATR